MNCDFRFTNVDLGTIEKVMERALWGLGLGVVLSGEFLVDV